MGALGIQLAVSKLMEAQLLHACCFLPPAAGRRSGQLQARTKGLRAPTLTPTVATLANRNVVMPPSTGWGMVVIKAATLAKMPARISQKEVAKPAVLQQRCSARSALIQAGGSP
jgi:hypothetical protein